MKFRKIKSKFRMMSGKENFLQITTLL